jgi:hypothetical protein
MGTDKTFNDVITAGRRGQRMQLDSGQTFILAPQTDATGSIEIGNGTQNCDLKVFLGASTDFVLFDESAGHVQFDSAELNMGDGDAIEFGDGQDIAVAWDGSGMTSGPASGMWTGCPSSLDPSPYRYFEFFDDFFEPPLDANLKWVEVDDGTTGTNAISDIAGGVGTVVTAAADNDYHAISSKSECFNLVNTKELWFEARFRVVEATTNESAWWFGLTDTLTTGGLQADAAGPLASYDGILIWKDEATMAIDAETSNAGTQDTETNMGTFVTNTWTRVAFHVSAAATTAVVTPYFDLSDSGTLTAHSATMNLTRAGLEAMHVVAGIKAGPTAAAETLEIDYIRCVQVR